LGNIIPKNSSEIASSPFGIQAGTMEDSLLLKAAQIGVKWTRLLAGWEGIEKEKGVYIVRMKLLSNKMHTGKFVK